jgi:hypothetical protein
VKRSEAVWLGVYYLLINNTDVQPLFLLPSGLRAEPAADGVYLFLFVPIHS